MITAHLRLDCPRLHAATTKTMSNYTLHLPAYTRPLISSSTLGLDVVIMRRDGATSIFYCAELNSG